MGYLSNKYFDLSNPNFYFKLKLKNKKNKTLNWKEGKLDLIYFYPYQYYEKYYGDDKINKIYLTYIIKSKKYTEQFLELNFIIKSCIEYHKNLPLDCDKNLVFKIFFSQMLYHFKFYNGTVSIICEYDSFYPDNFPKESDDNDTFYPDQELFFELMMDYYNSLPGDRAIFDGENIIVDFIDD